VNLVAVAESVRPLRSATSKPFDTSSVQTVGGRRHFLYRVTDSPSAPSLP